MSARKRLPIGIQTFAKIREDNCCYVDKTPQILRLVDEGTHYFLSRPRRFGKSLLLDTMAELFEGKRALFEGLHAQQHWDWSRAYRSDPIAQYEGYYASVFYSHFAALGLDIRLEDVTHHGRIDMPVLFNGNVYLFEFKVVELAPEGRALQQIKDRGHAEKYLARGEPIRLIGIEFSKERRSVVGFEVKTVQLQRWRLPQCTG